MTKGFIRNFISFTLLILSFSSFAEDKELAKIFDNHNVVGTIVISSMDGDLTYIHNDNRANTRLCPASTFKIPNSLIAIEEKVLKDEHEIIPWNGTKYSIEAWNKDQNLNTAFKASCVWAYQKIADKVGRNKYNSYLNNINYGNKHLGSDVLRFWLDDSLKISPMEQIEFLKGVYLQKFNFSQKSYNTLKEIMLNEHQKDYDIYAKTGWNTVHGWYVGYIESKGKVWFFATNILVDNQDNLKLRKLITLESLKQKNIINKNSYNKDNLIG